MPREVYAGLADLVLVMHLAFIAFVAVGALLAWRWPRLHWIHLPAVVYAAAIVVIGFDCPLTGLEKHLRRLAGGPVYDGGFVNHYLTNVVYPGRLLGLLRWLIVAGIVVGYGGSYLRWRHREGRHASDAPPANAISAARGCSGPAGSPPRAASRRS